jgi:hypothetical protein
MNFGKAFRSMAHTFSDHFSMRAQSRVYHTRPAHERLTSPTSRSKVR